MKLNKCFFIVTTLILFVSSSFYGQTTIEQWLDVVRNDGVVGGEFHVAINVKGTDLTITNTLGSATIDVVYNNSQLNYLGGAIGVIIGSDGYSLSLDDNGTVVRFGVTGGGVGPAFTDDGPGHDLLETYETFITVHFQIVDDQLPADLFIAEATNQIGLFDSHANSNSSGIINNQTLSLPIEILNEPLPIELVSFAANYSNLKIGLEWQTATEIDNYGFEIERKEAETENAQWRNISFIAGAGNSNSKISYTYFDENLKSDHYFYRLKQIDNDGSYTYSGEVEVKFDLIAEDFTLTQNYPNPFNPSTQIKFGFKEDTQASLKVYNTIGELVSVLFNSKASAGNLYGVTFNADNLPSGMYIYELRSEKFTEVRKMLLLK
ncbi:MAG: T9SS type A sorting domain-containing protein [Ignavibacteriae bacterium]|nr:T9SS C-terminal target domain-containing protein [Ignavibacteriota bacterium]NOG99514.1 T9SS type A sorting domain-containing protein [Ignavibacteriota bacterium]